MIVDIVVAVVVLISALISFMRGFIREVLTIIGVVGGIVAAILLGPQFVPVVNNWYGVEEGAKDVPKLLDLVPLDMVAAATAYGLIFLVVVIVLSVVSHFLAAGAKAIGLGPIDRTMGVIFGVVRAVVLLGLLYLPFHMLMDKESGAQTKAEFFADSRSFIIIEKTAGVLATLLPNRNPDEIRKKAEDTFKKNLMEQELLKGSKEEGAGAQDGKGAKKEGYDDEQREELKDLFENEAERQYND